MNITLQLISYNLVAIFVLISLQAVSILSQCFRYTSLSHNPCLKKDCPLGAECIPSSDGKSAECVCPARCPSYGDSRGSKLLCGSNGHDYPNLCELNRYTCGSDKEIFVRYNGSCDPCYGVKCPASQICQIDDNRNSICKCNAACGKEFDPVCGSNGKTYINECILRVEACQSRKSLRILHQGSCGESNACKALKCFKYEECEINRYGIAVCQCTSTCSKILKPVCGTDGETYDSECHLERQACLLHKNITIRYHGICDPNNFCHNNHGVCKFGSTCTATKLNNYTCICPKCSEEYSPVCGSNGITYINSCKFRQDMCEKRIANITFREGTCVGCENMNCQFYSFCKADIDGAKCVCPDKCDKNPDPVCGSDFVTYLNDCELRKNSCNKREYIMAIKRGHCNSCQNIHCDYGARCENGACVCPRKCPSYIEPVCGSNNVTYDNQCKLMAASCDSTTQISVQFKDACKQSTLPQKPDPFSTLCDYNTCKYGGICVLDRKQNAQCYCNFNCPQNSGPNEQICGNDGRMYKSECIFQEEMCNRQQEIKRHDPIFCEKYRNIPCQGEPPLLNPTTNKEYDCHTKVCPKDSYCHKGPNFAKCCKEIDFEEDCYDTIFGCCPDEKTQAYGPNHSGCPSTCQCNRLGSYLLKCDAITKQCYCKPGVGGLRCDRCEAGFWGLHKISEGNAGCIPCKCNQIGLSRDDCEQMTGRCVCKPGFKGMKCDMCADGSPAESDKCTHSNIFNKNVNISCQSNNQCKFNSVCNQSQCVCDFKCPDQSNAPVCGSDGNTYKSDCHLRLLSCIAQKTLSAMHFEKCQSTTFKHSATTSPVRRSTEYQNYGKSTKHLSTEAEFLANIGPTLPTIDQAELRFFNSLFFNGDSYVEMDTLQAYSKVSIRIEFNSFAPDGILLYNGQTNTGEGDYISLLIKNLFIELRFNLGSGNVLLRSKNRISLGTNITVEVERHLSEALLSIVGSENITGKSEGPHKLLDLGQNLFIGGTPYSDIKRFSEIVGTKNNFVGRILMLQINEQEIMLEKESSRETVNLFNVDMYSMQSCLRMFCKNGGTCLEESESLVCLCSEGYTGKQCDKHEEDFQMDLFSILDFWNSSYLQLPTMAGVSQAFVIEIWLMTRSLHGLILYNGQTQGDFVELFLQDGHVCFNFNLGGGQANKSGVVSIKSRTPLSLGEWHRIVISRKLKEGRLQIDDRAPIEGVALGNLNELNLDQPLFIGGREQIKTSNNNSNNIPFNGAIQRVVLNGNILHNLLNRSTNAHSANIQQYQGPPCGYNNPCLNQGKCVAWLSNFICQCPDNYEGETCEREISNSKYKSVLFTNGTQIPFNDSDFSIIKHSQNLIKIKLRTQLEDGLILWVSLDSNTGGDYLAVTLNNGYVEFSFDLGKQSSYLGIRSTIRINDGELHQITIYRNKRIGIMELDDKFMTSGVSEEGAENLNTNGILWIGGYSNLPSNLPKYYYNSLKGCFVYLKIEGVVVNFADTTHNQLQLITC